MPLRFPCLRRPLLALIAGMALVSVADAQDARTPFVDARMTDVEIIYTSGTVVLQRMRTTEASFTPDRRSLVTRNVEVEVVRPGEPSIFVSSPLARYFLVNQGDPIIVPTATGVPLLEDLAPLLVQTEIAFQGDLPIVEPARRGDLVLIDPERSKGVSIKLGADGQLDANSLLWRESLNVFLSPDDFSQTYAGSEGSFHVTGRGFIASRDFSEWFYRTVDGIPVIVEVEE